jgi:hypothetical protein
MRRTLAFVFVVLATLLLRPAAALIDCSEGSAGSVETRISVSPSVVHVAAPRSAYSEPWPAAFNFSANTTRTSLELNIYGPTTPSCAADLRATDAIDWFVPNIDGINFDTATLPGGLAVVVTSNVTRSVLAGVRELTIPIWACAAGKRPPVERGLPADASSLFDTSAVVATTVAPSLELPPQPLASACAQGRIVIALFDVNAQGLSATQRDVLPPALGYSVNASAVGLGSITAFQDMQTDVITVNFTSSVDFDDVSAVSRDHSVVRSGTAVAAATTSAHETTIFSGPSTTTVTSVTTAEYAATQASSTAKVLSSATQDTRVSGSDTSARAGSSTRYVLNDDSGRPTRMVDSVGGSPFAHVESRFDYASAFDSQPARATILGYTIDYNATSLTSRRVVNASLLITTIDWCPRATEIAGELMPCRIVHALNSRDVATFDYTWNVVAGRAVASTITETHTGVQSQLATFLQCNLTHVSLGGRAVLTDVNCSSRETNTSTSVLRRRQYQYDGFGELTTMRQTPSGDGISIAYDSAGVPARATISNAADASITAISHLHVGSALRRRVDSAVAVAFTFAPNNANIDGALSFASASVRHALTNEPLSETHLHYDAHGHLALRYIARADGNAAATADPHRMDNLTFNIDAVTERLRLVSRSGDGSAVYAAQQGGRGEDFLAWVPEHGESLVLFDAFGARGLASVALSRIVEWHDLYLPGALFPASNKSAPLASLTPFQRFAPPVAVSGCLDATVDILGNSPHEVFVTDVCRGEAFSPALQLRFSLPAVPSSVAAANATGAAALAAAWMPLRTSASFAAASALFATRERWAWLQPAVDPVIVTAASYRSAVSSSEATLSGSSDVGLTAAKRELAAKLATVCRIAAPENGSPYNDFGPLCVTAQAYAELSGDASLTKQPVVLNLAEAYLDSSKSLDASFNEAFPSSPVPWARTTLQGWLRGRLTSGFPSDAASFRLANVGYDHTTNEVLIFSEPRGAGASANVSAADAQELFAYAMRATANQRRRFGDPLVATSCSTDLRNSTHACVSLSSPRDSPFDIIGTRAESLPESYDVATPTVLRQAIRDVLRFVHQLATGDLADTVAEPSKVTSSITPLSDRLAAERKAVPTFFESILNAPASLGCATNATAAITLEISAASITTTRSVTDTGSPQISVSSRITEYPAEGGTAIIRFSCVGVLGGVTFSSSGALAFCSDLNAALATRSSPAFPAIRQQLDIIAMFVASTTAARWIDEIALNNGRLSDYATDLGLGTTPAPVSSIPESSSTYRISPNVTVSSTRDCRNVTVSVANRLWRDPAQSGVQFSSPTVVQTHPFPMVQTLLTARSARRDGGVPVRQQAGQLGTIPLRPGQLRAMLTDAPATAPATTFSIVDIDSTAPGGMPLLRRVADPTSIVDGDTRSDFGHTRWRVAFPLALRVGVPNALTDGSTSAVVYNELLLVSELPSLAALLGRRGNAGDSHTVRFVPLANQLDLISNGLWSVYVPAASAAAEKCRGACQLLRLVQYNDSFVLSHVDASVATSGSHTPVAGVNLATFDLEGKITQVRHVGPSSACQLRFGYDAGRLGSVVEDCRTSTREFDIVRDALPCGNASLSKPLEPSIRRICLRTDAAACVHYNYSTLNTTDNSSVLCVLTGARSTVTAESPNFQQLNEYSAADALGWLSGRLQPVVLAVNQADGTRITLYDNRNVASVTDDGLPSSLRVYNRTDRGNLTWSADPTGTLFDKYFARDGSLDALNRTGLQLTSLTFDPFGRSTAIFHVPGAVRYDTDITCVAMASITSPLGHLVSLQRRCRIIAAAGAYWNTTDTTERILDVDRNVPVSERTWDRDGRIVHVQTAQPPWASAPSSSRIDPMLPDVALSPWIAVHIQYDGTGRPSLIRLGHPSEDDAAEGLFIGYTDTVDTTTVKIYPCRASDTPGVCNGYNRAAVPVINAATSRRAVDNAECATLDAASHNSWLAGTSFCFARLRPLQRDSLALVSITDSNGTDLLTVDRRWLRDARVVTGVTIRQRATGVVLYASGDVLDGRYRTAYNSTLRQFQATVSHTNDGRTRRLSFANNLAAIDTRTTVAIEETERNAERPSLVLTVETTSPMDALTRLPVESSRTQWRIRDGTSNTQQWRIPLEVTAGIVRRFVGAGSDLITTDFVFPTAIRLGTYDMTSPTATTWTLFVTVPRVSNVSVVVTIPNGGCTVSEYIYPTDGQERLVRVLGRCRLFGEFPVEKIVEVSLFVDGHNATQSLPVIGFGYVPLPTTVTATETNGVYTVSAPLSQAVRDALRETAADNEYQFPFVRVLANRDVSNIIASHDITNETAELFDAPELRFPAVSIERPIDSPPITVIGIALSATRFGSNVPIDPSTVQWVAVAAPRSAAQDAAQQLNNGLASASLNARIARASSFLFRTARNLDAADLLLDSVPYRSAAGVLRHGTLAVDRNRNVLTLYTSSISVVVPIRLPSAPGNDVCSIDDAVITWSTNTSKFIVAVGVTCTVSYAPGGRGVVVRSVSEDGVVGVSEFTSYSDSRNPRVEVDASGNIFVAAVAWTTPTVTFVRVSNSALKFLSFMRLENTTSSALIRTVRNYTGPAIVVCVSASFTNGTHIVLRVSELTDQSTSRLLLNASIASPSNVSRLSVVTLPVPAVQWFDVPYLSLAVALTFIGSDNAHQALITFVDFNATASAVTVAKSVALSTLRNATLCPGSTADSLIVLAMSDRGVVQLVNAAAQNSSVALPSLLNANAIRPLTMTTPTVAVFGTANRASRNATDGLAGDFRLRCRSTAADDARIVAAAEASSNTLTVAELLLPAMFTPLPRMNVTAIPASITVPYPPVTQTLRFANIGSGLLIVAVDTATVASNFILDRSAADNATLTITATQTAFCGCSTAMLYTNAGDTQALPVCSYGGCVDASRVSHTPGAISQTGTAFTLSALVDSAIPWTSAQFVFRDATTQAESRVTARSGTSPRVDSEGSAGRVPMDLFVSAEDVPAMAQSYCRPASWRVELRDIRGNPLMTFGPFAASRPNPPSPFLWAVVSGPVVYLDYRDVGYISSSLTCLRWNLNLQQLCFHNDQGQMEMTFTESSNVTFDAYVGLAQCQSFSTPQIRFAVVAGAALSPVTAPAVTGASPPAAVTALRRNTLASRTTATGSPGSQYIAAYGRLTVKVSDCSTAVTYVTVTSFAGGAAVQNVTVMCDAAGTGSTVVDLPSGRWIIAAQAPGVMATSPSAVVDILSAIDEGLPRLPKAVDASCWGDTAVAAFTSPIWSPNATFGAAALIGEATPLWNLNGSLVLSPPNGTAPGLSTDPIGSLNYHTLIITGPASGCNESPQGPIQRTCHRLVRRADISDITRWPGTAATTGCVLSAPQYVSVSTDDIESVLCEPSTNLPLRPGEIGQVRATIMLDHNISLQFGQQLDAPMVQWNSSVAQSGIATPVDAGITRPITTSALYSTATIVMGTNSPPRESEFLARVIVQVAVVTPNRTFTCQTSFTVNYKDVPPAPTAPPLPPTTPSPSTTAGPTRAPGVTTTPFTPTPPPTAEPTLPPLETNTTTAIITDTTTSTPPVTTTGVAPPWAPVTLVLTFDGSFARVFAENRTQLTQALIGDVADRLKLSTDTIRVSDLRTGSLIATLVIDAALPPPADVVRALLTTNTTYARLTTVAGFPVVIKVLFDSRVTNPTTATPAPPPPPSANVTTTPAPNGTMIPTTSGTATATAAPLEEEEPVYKKTWFIVIIAIVVVLVVGGIVVAVIYCRRRNRKGKHFTAGAGTNTGHRQRTYVHPGDQDRFNSHTGPQLHGGPHSNSLSPHSPDSNNGTGAYGSASLSPGMIRGQAMSQSDLVPPARLREAGPNDSFSPVASPPSTEDRPKMPGMRMNSPLNNRPGVPAAPSVPAPSKSLNSLFGPPSNDLSAARSSAGTTAVVGPRALQPAGGASSTVAAAAAQHPRFAGAKSAPTPAGMQPSSAASGSHHHAQSAGAMPDLFSNSVFAAGNMNHSENPAPSFTTLSSSADNGMGLDLASPLFSGAPTGSDNPADGTIRPLANTAAYDHRPTPTAAEFSAAGFNIASNSITPADLLLPGTSGSPRDGTDPMMFSHSRDGHFTAPERSRVEQDPASSTENAVTTTSDNNNRTYQAKTEIGVSADASPLGFGSTQSHPDLPAGEPMSPFPAFAQQQLRPPVAPTSSAFKRPSTPPRTPPHPLGNYGGTAGQSSSMLASGSRRWSEGGNDIETEQLVDQVGSPPMSPYRGTYGGALSESQGFMDARSLEMLRGVNPAQFMDQPVMLTPRDDTPALASGGSSDPMVVYHTSDERLMMAGSLDRPSVDITLVVTETLDYNAGIYRPTPICSIVGQLTLMIASTVGSTQRLGPHKQTCRIAFSGAVGARLASRLQVHPSVQVVERGADWISLIVQVPELDPGVSSRSIVARYTIAANDGALDSLPLKLQTSLMPVPGLTPAAGHYPAVVTLRFTWNPITAASRQSASFRLPLPPAPSDATRDSDGQRVLLLRPAPGTGVTEGSDDEVVWTVLRGAHDLVPDGPANPLAAKFTSAVPVLPNGSDEPDPLPVHASIVLNGRLFTDTNMALTDGFTSSDVPVVSVQPTVLMARTASYIVEAVPPDV